MTEEDNGNVTEDSLLLVSGNKGSKSNDKDYVKKLANAICKVYFKHDTVKLRCVGAASLNNAVKAFIIAKEEIQKDGDNVLMSPSFVTVDFQGEEKTGIVLDILSSRE